MRPYYWPQRIAIALACAGAVLVLSLTGCDLFSSDFRECGAMCGSKGAASVTYTSVNGFRVPSCVCRSGSTADGGGR